MKKFFLFFIIILIFNACSNIPKSIWRSKEDTSSYSGLRAGDIIIKEKEFSILGMLGHSGIMRTRNLIVDYPKFGASSFILNIEDWLEEDRNFIVMRYIDMDETFRQKLLENIDSTLDKKYRITFDKANSNAFYCSQYIWYLYYITAKELNRDLDIDSDKGFFVFPYDFIKSKELFILK